MKHTSIDWAPYIPSSWQEVRLKDIAKLESGSSITSDDIDQLGEYPVFGGNGLRGFTDSYTNDGYHVLIGRQGALCGNINYAEGKFFASEHAVVVYPYDKKESVIWLGETLKAANLNRLSASAAQPGLAVNVLNFQMIPYPPKDVRKKIGEYLDAKTSEIDRKISLLERKKDAYLRLKTATINHAITRGLNPDAKLKDSGVEWIGLVPEHWEVKRLKDMGYLYSGLTGKSGDDFRNDDDSVTKLYIPFTNILYNLEVSPDLLNRVVMEESEYQNKVKKGDLIFLMSSEDYESIAKSAVVSEDIGEVYLNSFCRGYRILRSKIDPMFVNFQLNSMIYRNRLRLEARGFTRINMKVDKIASISVVLPSYDDQRKIVAYLREQCNQIDIIIRTIDRQAETYKRLKRSLINEVVTGQRTV